MSKNKKNNTHVTWAQAFRDIVIHSVNKGVLLPVGLFLFIIVPILKLSQEDSSRFINDIMNALVDGYLLGWVLFIVTVISWGMFAKKPDKVIVSIWRLQVMKKLEFNNSQIQILS